MPAASMGVGSHVQLSDEQATVEYTSFEFWPLQVYKQHFDVGDKEGLTDNSDSLRCSVQQRCTTISTLRIARCSKRLRG
eukprot:10129070-Alexandrium_andersonii.AAC.1